jgi:hypothetical protein
VQKAIKEKKWCFRRMHLDRSVDNVQRYKVAKKTAKRAVSEARVKDVLKRMKGGKAMGPDGIPIEVWRTLENIAIFWLTKLFNLIFRSNKMSDEWRQSILVPIFKNKRDVQSCTNYRGSN